MFTTMLAALLISVSLLLAALGFFAFTLSALQRMLVEKQEAEDRLVDSERHLQSIIDSATGLIFVTDLDGRLLLVNRAFERALGAGRIEAIGKKPAELFGPAVSDALERGREEAPRTATPLEYDLELHLPGGHRAYIATRFALTDSAGRAYATCGVLTDITERKRALADRMKIFDLSLDMMCVTAFDGYQVLSNPQFSKILGYSRHELLSRPFFDFVHPDDHESTRSAVERLRQGENLVDFVNRGVCKDGSIQWISWRVAADVEEGRMICVGRPIADPAVVHEVGPAAEQALESGAQVSAERIVSLREAKARRENH